MKTSLLKWYVDYESSGKLAGKPFHETGKANITFGKKPKKKNNVQKIFDTKFFFSSLDNLELNTTLSLGFKEVDGKKYIEALSGDTVTTSKFNFQPYNQVSHGEAMTGD